MVDKRCEETNGEGYKYVRLTTIPEEVLEKEGFSTGVQGMTSYVCYNEKEEKIGAWPEE